MRERTPNFQFLHVCSSIFITVNIVGDLFDVGAVAVADMRAAVDDSLPRVIDDFQSPNRAH